MWRHEVLTLWLLPGAQPGLRWAEWGRPSELRGGKTDSGRGTRIAYEANAWDVQAALSQGKLQLGELSARLPHAGL